jgi:hypothetical protein
MLRRQGKLDAVLSEYAPPTPVEGFLNPDDPILFRRLTAAQIEKLAEGAETQSLSPGEGVLFAPQNALYGVAAALDPH